MRTLAMLTATVSVLLYGSLVDRTKSTEGIITGHPVGANYVQAPSAVTDGPGVRLVFDYGNCCYAMEDPRGGETLASVGYGTLEPGGLTYPIVSTRDILDGHEAYGPSSVLFLNDWYTFYSSTQWSTYGQPNRVGVGVAISPTLTAPPVVHHRLFATVAADVFVIAAVVKDDRLEVFMRLNGTAVPPAIKCYLSTTWGTPMLGDCVALNLGGVPCDFSDIAYDDRNHRYVALSGTNNGNRWLTEWESRSVRIAAGEVIPAGEVWTKTGNIYASERPKVYVFDGGFMRDERGYLASPLTIVANHSNGGEPWTGTWKLWWWSEDAKQLPGEWGSHIY